MRDGHREAPPQPQIPAAEGPPGRAWLRTAGRVIVYLVAGALNTVALLCVFFLWLAWLSGKYKTDRDLLENDAIWLVSMGLAGASSAGVSLLITAVAAKVRWMPRWAIALPGILLTATVIASCAMSEVYGAGQ